MSSKGKGGTTLTEVIAIVVIVAVGIAIFYFTGIWTPGK